MLSGRKKYFRFTEKKHSKKGIVAFAFAAVLLVVYFLFLLLADHSNGNLSMYIGSAGVLAMLLSLADVIAAIGCMRDENVFPLFPRMALISSISVSLIWIGTFVLGLV